MSEQNQNYSADPNFPSPQAEAIIVLKETIVKLEGVISQLQTQYYNIKLPLESCQELLTTAQNLAQSLNEISEAEVIVETPSYIEENLLKEERLIEPILLVNDQQDEQKQLTIELKTEEVINGEFSREIPKKGLDQILPSFSKVLKWWDRFLLKIRAYLPSKINDQISDWGLTGIMSVLIVLILLTSVLLLPDNQDNSPVITELPNQEIQEPIEISQPNNEPIEVIKTPSELTEPKAPIPIKEVEPPKPKLTPEQKLITGIKNQVASLTNQYAEGLIFSIKADFTKSRLQIIVTENWQEINFSERQKLSNKMLNKAEFLDFKKLEILNKNGDLLARSPVVGNEMILIAN